METISQRELRNENARIVRAVESGESFLVTRNGVPVAVLRPAGPDEVSPGLPISQRAARRVDYRQWPRVASAVSSEDVLADLRDER